MRTNFTSGRGIFILVKNFKGEDVKPLPLLPTHDPDDLPDRPFLDTEEFPELDPLRAQWRKQGLSEEDARWKAIEYVKRRRGEEARRHRFSTILKPGQSVATPPWIYDGRAKPWLNQPARGPIGDFAELRLYGFDKPGKFRVKAVYDLRLWYYSPAEWKELRKLATHSRALKETLTHLADRKPESDEVRAETPWIDIRVEPEIGPTPAR